MSWTVRFASELSCFLVLFRCLMWIIKFIFVDEHCLIIQNNYTNLIIQSFEAVAKRLVCEGTYRKPVLLISNYFTSLSFADNLELASSYQNYHFRRGEKKKEKKKEREITGESEWGISTLSKIYGCNAFLPHPQSIGFF